VAASLIERNKEEQGCLIRFLLSDSVKKKAVPLHAMEAHGV
jgi:hypothetical protein